MLRLAVIALFFVPFAIFVGWLIFGAIGVWRGEMAERAAPTVFNPNRAYINWRPRDGWPRGPFLNYECVLCGASVPSKTGAEMRCECGNLFVGPEQIGAREEEKVRLFEERPENNPNPLAR